MRNTAYLRDIHVDLLKFDPMSPTSIAAFVEKLGLDELILWALELDLRTGFPESAWYQLGLLISTHEQPAPVPLDLLIHAISVESADGVRKEQDHLRRGFELASEHSASETLKLLRDTTGLWPKPELRLTTRPMLMTDGSTELMIVEAPAHIFARAWLELFDALERRNLPQICVVCECPFVRVRSDQIYCSQSCRGIAAGTRPRSSHRREYERQYKRMQRNQITREELDDWLKSQNRS